MAVPKLALHATTLPSAACNRRAFMSRPALTLLAATFTAVGRLPLPASAANNVPLLGRFEALKGAKSFIGRWELLTTEGPQGDLQLSKSGDVELRERGSNRILGYGTEPWSYFSAKGDDTLVRLSFNVDVDTADYGVLVYRGVVDSAGGPDRVMEGTILSNGRQCGGFTAKVLPE